MINSDEFTNRLKKILDYYDLSAALFADKIGVQRSSISHILSGRNKPSLDFILKITAVFEEVDLYWLVDGKGHFPKKTANDDYSSTPTFAASTSFDGKKIQRIVVFYTDGTFDEYYK
ncbi:helix-turn-helix transcriptional regulator [Polaribacter sp.]|uniref:helix-turn-helix transcriptional regulator n=1 Tax=Polaribacter sp. TaxID=1920175 RepID=UPI004048545C